MNMDRFDWMAKVGVDASEIAFLRTTVGTPSAKDARVASRIRHIMNYANLIRAGAIPMPASMAVQ